MSTLTANASPSIASLTTRFDDLDSYFEKLVSMDTARAYAETCADWLISHPTRALIDYDPFTPLSHQPGCIKAYFDQIARCGVSINAEEYLTTRSWFMCGTVSAPILLAVALSGRGHFVNPVAGNFPEDLCYIMSAQ